MPFLRRPVFFFYLMFLELCLSYRNLSPIISQLRLPIPNGFLSYDTFCLSLFADVSWNERSLFYLSFNYFICLLFFALTKIAKDGVVLSSYWNWGTCKTKQKVSMMYKGWPASLIFYNVKFCKVNMHDWRSKSVFTISFTASTRMHHPHMTITFQL